MSGVSVRRAESQADLDTVAVLLGEYLQHLLRTLGAEHLDLPRYQRELADLESSFAALLLAFVRTEAAGCVLLRPLAHSGEEACELKRLWTRPQFRGLGIGRLLTESAMQEARQRGFRVMHLDTVPSSMQPAVQLYESLGFQPCERASDHPGERVRFYRCALVR